MFGTAFCDHKALVALVVLVVGLAVYVGRLKRRLFEAVLLKRYAISHSSILETTALKSLREETRTHPEGEMESSEDVGQLLVMFMRMLDVKKVLEIGTFTGVATLKIAENLPAEGEIVTLDIDDTFVGIGRPFFEEANVSHKIDVQINKAVDSLKKMLDDGKRHSFDMAFIDADKFNYPKYYKYCLELVRPGGIIVFDNSMFCRKLPWNVHKEPYKFIDQVNEWAKTENNTTSMLLTIGDGTLVIWKHRDQDL